MKRMIKSSTNTTWEMVDQQQVIGYEGKITDCTIYANEDNSYFIGIIADEDSYIPDISICDFETESYDEIYEWFEEQEEADGIY